MGTSVIDQILPTKKLYVMVFVHLKEAKSVQDQERSDWHQWSIFVMYFFDQFLANEPNCLAHNLWSIALVYKQCKFPDGQLPLNTFQSRSKPQNSTNCTFSGLCFCSSQDSVNQQVQSCESLLMPRFDSVLYYTGAVTLPPYLPMKQTIGGYFPNSLHITVLTKF